MTVCGQGQFGTARLVGLMILTESLLDDFHVLYGTTVGGNGRDCRVFHRAVVEGTRLSFSSVTSPGCPSTGQCSATCYRSRLARRKGESTVLLATFRIRSDRK